MGIAAMSRTYHAETVPFTGRTRLVVRSRRDIRALTEFYFARFKKEQATRILPGDDENSVRVNRILSKVVGAIQPILASRTWEPLDWAARLKWEAVIVRHKGFRARCWAGAGKIEVYTGLLDRFRTDEEIAAVLAHEVGHVIARHSSEMITRLASRKWFLAFLLRPFFRRQELEADYIGMLLLAASGFDPHVAPRAVEEFGKMGRKHIFNNILYFFALSTHPSPKERSRILSRPKVMEEAMELYTQAVAVRARAKGAKLTSRLPI